MNTTEKNLLIFNSNKEFGASDHQAKYGNGQISYLIERWDDTAM